MTLFSSWGTSSLPTWLRERDKHGLYVWVCVTEVSRWGCLHVCGVRIDSRGMFRRGFQTVLTTSPPPQTVSFTQLTLISCVCLHRRKLCINVAKAECRKANKQAGGWMINLLTFVDEPQQGEGHAGKRDKKRENISGMSKMEAQFQILLNMWRIEQLKVNMKDICNRFYFCKVTETHPNGSFILF